MSFISMHDENSGDWKQVGLLLIFPKLHGEDIKHHTISALCVKILSWVSGRMSSSDDSGWVASKEKFIEDTKT
jgi:hypothetical protein